MFLFSSAKTSSFGKLDVSLLGWSCLKSNYNSRLVLKDVIGGARDGSKYLKVTLFALYYEVSVRTVFPSLAKVSFFVILLRFLMVGRFLG